MSSEAPGFLVFTRNPGVRFCLVFLLILTTTQTPSNLHTGFTNHIHLYYLSSSLLFLFPCLFLAPPFSTPIPHHLSPSPTPLFSAPVFLLPLNFPYHLHHISLPLVLLSLFLQFFLVFVFSVSLILN